MSPRLVYVVTHPVTADALLRGHLAFMRENGMEVTVIGAPGPLLDRVAARERVATVAVPMVRANDARKDAASLVALTRVLRRLRPDIVNAGTPKAGLLGMIAARAVATPVRIYLLRGLRLEGAEGPLRWVLGATERVASACAHEVWCVSPSLMKLSVEGGYVPRRKARVIAAGSSNGFDTERYTRTPELRTKGARLLEKLGIAESDLLVGFVGRLVADKGVDELLSAFERVRAAVPRARLLLLGGDLGDEQVDPALAARVRRADGVVATGVIDDLAPYYARIDVLAAPTYREGFPNVIGEAQSAGVPVVAFRSTGVVDAVEEGSTALLVDPGDAEGLARGVVRYLESPDLRALHGAAARARIVRLFSREDVWRAWLDAYRTLLRARGLSAP